MRNLILLSFIMMFSSCALMTDRTFVDQMEHDEDDVFIPGQDFSVIPGDTGNAYRSREEIKRRTPRTGRELASDKLAMALEDELEMLESRQSDRKYAHYLKYRTALKNNSQKIYFLKMRSIQEREEYLFGLGVKSSPYYNAPEVNAAIQNRDVVLGMDKDSVVKAWGRPIRVDIAGNPRYENERWMYTRSHEKRYIFFENGRVEGWSIGN